MINHLKLVNFKNHRDTELSFGRITALIGPNGAGKSSVLEAINYLSQLANDDSRKIFSGESDEEILTQNSKNRFSIKASGQEGSNNWVAQVDLIKKHRNDKLVWLPQLRWEYGGDAKRVSDDFPTFSAHSAIASVLMAIRWLKLNGAALGKPSFLDLKPQIASDGSNLASVVANLILGAPDRFAELLKALQEVIPSIQRIRSQPKHISTDSMNPVATSGVGYELLFDTEKATGIPAHAMSEGTLYVVGLLAALMSPNNPKLLLIDDLEQGLHPKAQRNFIEVLKKLLKARPDLQIIFTSHSPYIVDELDADDVWLLATDDEGISHAKKLSDHPDAKRALEVLTTGEFWSAEGEQWVLENNK